MSRLIGATKGKQMANRVGTLNEKPLTVAELIDFRMRCKAYADAPEQSKSLSAIVATRCAIDLDHLARLISSPSIDVGTYWVHVKPKAARKAKKPAKKAKARPEQRSTK